MFFLLLIFSLCKPVAAQVSSFTHANLPLFEIGAGVITVNYPDYPGSNRSRNLTLPIPTAVYRGNIVRADEDGGFRTRFLYSPRFEFNLSVGGSLPANSKDNPERAGMPNLDTVGELGPGLIIHLLEKSRTRPNRFGLNIPIRAAISTDFKSLDQRGYVFNPLLYYIHDRLFFDRITLFTSIDYRIADRTYHDMYYQVAPQFATATRPSYTARSGEVGVQYNLGFSYLYNNDWTIFAGMSYSDYSNNANKSSPLFRQDYSMTYAVGIVWWFYQSEQKAMQ